MRIKGKQVTLHALSKYLNYAQNDAKDALKFRLAATERKRCQEAYARCSSMEDYYQFASETIGLMQKKPEICRFLEFARSVAPRFVCEIGTYEGGTNFLLSQALPEVELMLGLDLFVQHKAHLRCFRRPNQRMIYLNGSSHTPQTVAKVQQILGGNLLDICFIDGDHRYDGVKQDFLCYRSLVRDGGIIAFHDIVPDFKTRHGRDTGMWAGEVPQFWCKLKAAYPHQEFVENPEQDAFGIGAIIYSADRSLPDDL